MICIAINEKGAVADHVHGKGSADRCDFPLNASSQRFPSAQEFFQDLPANGKFPTNLTRESTTGKDPTGSNPSNQTAAKGIIP